MKSSINIIKFEEGFILKVNEFYIHQSFSGHIKSVRCGESNYIGNENKNDNFKGVTIWKTVNGLKKFWNKNMNEIVESTKSPYIFNIKHNIHTIY